MLATKSLIGSVGNVIQDSSIFYLFLAPLSIISTLQLDSVSKIIGIIVGICAIIKFFYDMDKKHWRTRRRVRRIRKIKKRKNE